MATVTVDRTSQRFSSSAQPEPDVAVEHTTEVMAWPPYAGGGQAPHATIWPLPGVGVKVREHIPWTQNAKALMNLPGGVETNRRGVIQFELIGTCDPSKRGKPGWYFWPDADDVVLEALADYQRPILAQFGIPFTAPVFQAYSGSYGARGITNRVRMTNAQWLAFQGICGHQHVPENTHGDPGAFPIDRFLAFLRGTPQEDDMSAQDLLNAPAGVNPADKTKPVDVGDRLAIASNYAFYSWQILRAIAPKIGVDVDEQALAAEILSGLAPTVREAVATAAAAGGSPDQIAEAVVAKIGDAITKGA
jgi:hypothetical protein